MESTMVNFNDLLQVELRPDVVYVLETEMTLGQHHHRAIQDTWLLATTPSDGSAGPRLLVLDRGFRLARARERTETATNNEVTRTVPDFDLSLDLALETMEGGPPCAL
jgi:hypothetical protein